MTCQHNFDDVKHLHSEISHTKLFIKELVEHKNRQIDENRKISKRVDELEEFCKFHHKSIYKVIGDLNERIPDFEKEECRINSIEDRLNGLSHITDVLLVDDVKKRINELEKALENYREYKTSIEDLETDVMYLKKTSFVNDITQRLKHCAMVSEEEMSQIHQDLDDLDNYTTFIDNKIGEHSDIICKILESLDNLDKRVTHLESKGSSSKEPHKCPVCAGLRRIFNGE